MGRPEQLAKQVCAYPVAAVNLLQGEGIVPGLEDRHHLQQETRHVLDVDAWHGILQNNENPLNLRTMNS